MKVREIMERCGLNQTGLAVAYIKDGLEEIEMLTETHLKEDNINILANKRYYDIPPEAIKIIDITGKNQLNSLDEYKSIPRIVGAGI